MLTLPVYTLSPTSPLGPRVPFVVRETPPVTPPKPRLLDCVRAALRARHYSRRTEETYIAWIKRYIFFFHAKRHPARDGRRGGHPLAAVNGQVAASTKNQALSALLFLYRDVLDVDLPWPDGSRVRNAPCVCRSSSPARKSAPCCSGSTGCPA
jgi:hypothetical protein